MILIFSILGDFSTTIVCTWLRHYNKPFVRINGDNTNLKFHTLDKDKIIFEADDEKIDLNKSTSVWYRKSGLSLKNFDSNYAIKDEDFLYDKGVALKKIIIAENKTLISYLHKKIEFKKSIGKKYNADLNKLEVLDQAKAVGIKTPNTYVITQKSQLEQILIEEKELITKALDDNLYYFTEKNAYYTYTEKINRNNLNKLPDHFSPTLFQQHIRKKIEIRSFLLNGKFYSMAIFSQNDKKTELDYRRYNNSKPNRNVPFKLPDEIEKKLFKLYEMLNLNTGSADIILTEDSEFVFLEINPVGQFTMVSTPCNYYLEKKIANFLN